MALDGVLRFVEMLHAYRGVERAMYSKGLNRNENDVEHSYNLAMLAWYFIVANRLDLDLDRVLRYALVHDLVEVYAGDVDTYTKDPQARAGKAAREHEAAERLRQEFAEFPDLHRTIEEYEARKDRESRFVYVLDKLEPLFNSYLDGRIWKAKGVTRAELVAHKEDKMQVYPELRPYYEELMRIVDDHPTYLFAP